VLRTGSEFSLRLNAFLVRIMGLDVTGSATVSASAVKAGGGQMTDLQVVLGDFQFVDPEDGSVDVDGSGLTVNAEWIGFTVSGDVPASKCGALNRRTWNLFDLPGPSGGSTLL